MVLLKCTSEIRKALKLSDQNLAKNTVQNSSFNNWYVHRFRNGRTTFFVFMNELTLLSFVLYKGKKPITAQNIPAMLMNGVGHLLSLKGASEQTIHKVLDQFDAGLFGKTDSRRILGYMNEIVHTYRYFIESEGGLGSCNLTGIIIRVNDHIQRMLNYQSPWEATVGVLEHAERSVSRLH